MVRTEQNLAVFVRICLLINVFAILSGCEAPHVTIPQGPANPKTANDYARWAIYYSNHDDVNEAIASYTKAIALEPDVRTRCGYLLNRGMCLHNEYRHSLDPNAKQDIAGAEADFDEAVRLCPEDIWARQVRGLFYTNTERFDKGIEDYSILIAHEPSNPLHYSSRAMGYALKGDSERALADANQAIILSKGTKGLSEAFYYQRRACIHYKLKDINGALADFDKSIEISKGIDKCTPLLWKGDVLEKEGRLDAALQVFEQCLKEASVVPPGVIGGTMGGAAGVAQSGASLASPAGIFGVVVGAGLGATMFDDPGAYFREEAKRKIERIKAMQSSPTGSTSGINKISTCN